MKKNHSEKSLRRLAAAAAAALVTVCCQRAGEDSALTGSPDSPSGPFAFTIEEEAPWGSAPSTKSLLSDASIESKRTCASIGIYADGVLVDKRHFASLSSMSFPLEPGREYTACALVNMGDMTASFPGDAAGLPSVTYTITSYTGTGASVDAMGIPMAGSLTFTAGDGGTAIPVRRLLAKVTASLSCDWSGARIVAARVHNMNGVLRPFGPSAASGPGDMLAFQELQDASTPGAATLSATFYVPENMQGTVSAITSSADKAADRNGSVSANAAKLTYLEVEVASTGRYDGTIRYRSYLGGNATSSFDIERNRHYAWTIHYESSRVDDFTSDWKHVLEGVTVSDYSLSIAPDPRTIAVGESFTYAATLTRNILYPTPSSAASPLAGSSATWSSDNSAVARVSPSGVVTGVSRGTAVITVRYTPPGADFKQRTATAAVTVNTISHELVVTGAALAGDWTRPVELRAMYYTLTNGVRDGGTDVTASAVWSQDGGASYSIGEHTGILRAVPTAAVPSVAGTTVVTASYGGESATAAVTFNDVYTIEITDAEGRPLSAPKVAVGGTRVFKALYIQNGIRSAAPFATLATWESSSPGTAAVSGVTGAGAAILGVATGSATLRASYGGVTGSIPVTVTAWSDGWDDPDDPEIDL